MSLSKGITIVLKTKCPQSRCIPHVSLGLSPSKFDLQKNMLVDKIPQKTKIDSKKQKVHKGVAIVMEGEGL